MCSALAHKPLSTSSQPFISEICSGGGLRVTTFCLQQWNQLEYHPSPGKHRIYKWIQSWPWPARPRVSSDKGPAKPTKVQHQPLKCLSLPCSYCQQRNTANNYLSCGFQSGSTYSTQNYTAIFYSSYSIFSSKPELPQTIVFLSHCTWCTQASNSGTVWVDWSKGDLFVLIL